ncbi:AI-2E family transporter [Candidatus Protochlamydia phocaeensis]|uniref:AI-2E family transporter n=1 Tax=Candidatus Protochlamydia phocaeensis TaxID=1414722 RepID=UPI0008393F53|nr:AI-2E family transporter [Candidatus Protochlamydia phocaeensis]
MEEKKAKANTVIRHAISPWYYNTFFKYAVGTLLVLSIILIFYHVAFLLTPVFNFASSLFIPIVVSFLLYYLLRPAIYVLEYFRLPRFISILIVYVIIAILLVIFFAYIGPLLGEQVSAIANTSVETLEKIKKSSQSIISTGMSANLEHEIEVRVLGLIQQATALLSQNILDIVGFITRVATILAVIPFIVFYLLKDDHEIAAGFLKYTPSHFDKEMRKILKNIDDTLSSYINGLVMVSFSIGSMLFIGYLIIGLNYALVLSVFAFIFTTIPFVGSFLAIAPAILVGLSMSPLMTLNVIIVFVIVQQIESNIISPQIIGHRLNIRPLTLILLLLAAGSLYGLLGLLFATPFYAIFKVLAENLYKIYLLRYQKIQAKLSAPAE